ncbi:hypothetical protein [Methylomonas koyamae]|uniref:hypothetical protein n=1 Tax=Methylomonas koyamae TaxID=702114 RepID=UPI00112C9679|nr:hypothetical protein [Methylomonas koyamae]
MRSIVFGFLLLILMFICGCSYLQPHPDTCDHSHPSCSRELNNEEPFVLDTINSEKHIDICACKPLNNSHITVEKDQEYQFQIIELGEGWKDGSIASSLDDPEGGWTNPFMKIIGWFGSAYKRSSEAPWYALVGSVNNDEYTFPVFNEDGNITKIEQSGKLYFFANDMTGRYFNNKGAIKLLITRKN